MSRPQKSIPPLLGRGFTTAEARAAGLSPGRLSRPGVVRIAHGLYVREPEDADASITAHPAQRWRTTQTERARAVASLMGDRLFFCRSTAAALWGLPVTPTGSSDLEVAVLAPHRASQRRGFRARQISPRLVNVVEDRGLRLSDPSTSWAMLAGSLPARDAVALGDSVIHEARVPGTRRLKHSPLARLEDLRRAVAVSHRPCAERLREVLPLLSPHSASAPESHLRLLLRDWDLPAPELDFDIYDARGGLVGCSEFAYPQYRLAIEYEGAHHMHDAKQWNRDIEKYRDYAELGWEVIRVTAHMLYRQPLELRRQIFEALTRRAMDR